MLVLASWSFLLSASLGGETGGFFFFCSGSMRKKESGRGREREGEGRERARRRCHQSSRYFSSSLHQELFQIYLISKSIHYPVVVFLWIVYYNHHYFTTFHPLFHHYRLHFTIVSASSYHFTTIVYNHIFHLPGGLEDTNVLASKSIQSLFFFCLSMATISGMDDTSSTTL